MRPEPPERMPWPHVEIVPLITTFKDIALKSLHLIGDAIRHPGISDHIPDHDPLLMDYPDHVGQLPSHQDFEHKPKGW